MQALRRFSLVPTRLLQKVHTANEIGPLLRCFSLCPSCGNARPTCRSRGSAFLVKDVC